MDLQQEEYVFIVNAALAIIFLYKVKNQKDGFRSILFNILKLFTKSLIKEWIEPILTFKTHFSSPKFSSRILFEESYAASMRILGIKPKWWFNNLSSATSKNR